MPSHIRATVIGGFAAVASWLTLGLTLDHVALQRSVAVGPLTLIEQLPALAATVAVGVLVAGGLVRALALERGCSVSVLAGSLVADALAGFVLAPVLVGELEPQHGFTVTAVITGLGAAPLLSFGAALAAGRPGAQSRIEPSSRLTD